jgi:Na+-driven multidrug efflux pump
MSVVNRFTMFILCVGLGVGQGYQPAASFNYQAKEYNRVKKGLTVTMGLGALLVSFIAVPGFIFAKEIVTAFQRNPEVIEIGTYALRWATAGAMFLPLSVPVNMLYQSIRNVKISSFLSLMRSGLSFIPVLLITSRFLGLTGIQISQPIADMITGLVSVPFTLHFLFKDHEKIQTN